MRWKKLKIGQHFGEVIRKNTAIPFDSQWLTSKFFLRHPLCYRRVWRMDHFFETQKFCTRLTEVFSWPTQPIIDIGQLKKTI